MGKAKDMAQAISEQITQICDCEYSKHFVDNGQFFCSSSEKEIVYQARLLTTDGKTAEEIRKLTQKWVLTKPFVTISGKRHQLNPYCSVVIQEIGDLTCAILNVQSSSVRPSKGGGNLVGYSVGIVLFLSVMVGTISVAMILTFYAVKKYRLKKARDER